jgi:hypothetical protein
MKLSCALRTLRFLAFSLGRDRISAEVPYPPHDVVARAFDRLELCRAAQLVGMAVRETVPADDHSIANAELPVIVKIPSALDARCTTEACTAEAAICRDGESCLGGLLISGSVVETQCSRRLSADVRSTAW